MLVLITCYDSLNNLKKVSLETLTKNCEDFLRQDLIKLLNFIIRREAFDEFRKISFEIICKDPDLLFNSDEFPTLEKDVLVWILNYDDLDMKESEIWKRLIKWRIAKHSTFQNDMTKFTLEDFKTLKETLYKLIQLVRFHQINGAEFMLEVWPYRYLLSESLVEDLFLCYLVPDKKAIDNKSSKKTPYNFNLLFRSSIDGLSAQTFHNKSDNKGATIVMEKISNTNMLVEDLSNPQSAKIGRVTDKAYAVYFNSGYGPTFGYGYDLGASNDSCNWKNSLTKRMNNAMLN
ncbi:kelch-like protein 17 [Gigaspora margarita]|uniref:Kelch-like protein 17 n=1 Tax=Gigaspora margarita TaxID=4874 RepID=A0A8H3XDG7_GIGMA|nr:kelch-like protein 17 [Gigaspora margarita]